MRFGESVLMSICSVLALGDAAVGKADVVSGHAGRIHTLLEERFLLVPTYPLLPSIPTLGKSPGCCGI